MPERSRRPAQPNAASVVQRFFAPCPRGLESVLREELDALGAADAQALDGGVAFAGDLRLCYAANLHSRIASRVLWRLAQAPYRYENDVYQAVAALPWSEYFTPERTIRVNVSATACPLKSLDFVTLRIKDAVCDRFREQTGRRPSVDTAAPDVRIHAYLDASTLSLYLDTSGEPLFKRGLRVAAGEAPLRENLAAGILRLAGWSPGTPLLDPMCGGGTFLLEAAEAALQRAPGGRRSFAFEKLIGFDAARWAQIRAQAQAAERPAQPLPIFGSDLYGSALKLARENLSQAGLEGVVQLKQANALEISAPAAAGVLVANPPYGVRLGEQRTLAELYPRLGDALKQRFAGWRACIFTADLRLPKLIGLKPARRIPLYNGALECRLYVFELVAGSMRRTARDVSD
jgi:putative N6-adenine-specific DNA methylase